MNRTCWKNDKNEYVDKHHGINLSISGEYNEC
jgi:hypothetical protein